jgi:hypothetical protein
MAAGISIRRLTFELYRIVIDEVGEFTWDTTAGSDVFIRKFKQNLEQ